MIAPSAHRVRWHTRPEYNEQIHLTTAENVSTYAAAGPDAIEQRLQELDYEWDVERVLGANASTLILTGFLLGTLVNRRWHLLSAAVAGFYLQHTLQGWCPPINLFRRFGFRTQTEIEAERYALKALRGDFADVQQLDRERSHDSMVRVLQAVEA